MNAPLYSKLVCLSIQNYNLNIKIPWRAFVYWLSVLIELCFDGNSAEIRRNFP